MQQFIIQPQIISIEEFKVPDLFSDFIDIFKLVTSNLDITINCSKWTLPVQYIFSKELKTIYSQGADGYSQSKYVDGFYKMRIINKPLFELQTTSDFNDLIRLLFYLDSNSINEISASQFDKISVKDLVFKNDALNIDNVNQIEYEVRLYPNTNKNKDAIVAHKNHWSIPYVLLSGFNFDDEMIEEFSFPKQTCNINIVPKNYRCSFHKLITSESDLHSARVRNNSKYHVLYKGTYKECKDFFNEKNGLKRIASAELNKNIESPRGYDYNDSDYFDAMTDGQIGDYDDFTERGGNIDDIDTWSRR